MGNNLDYQNHRERLTLLFQRYGNQAVEREGLRMLGQSVKPKHDEMTETILHGFNVVGEVVGQLEAQRDAIRDLAAEYAEEIVRLGGTVPTCASPRPKLGDTDEMNGMAVILAAVTDRKDGFRVEIWTGDGCGKATDGGWCGCSGGRPGTDVYYEELHVDDQGRTTARLHGWLCAKCRKVTQTG